MQCVPGPLSSLLSSPFLEGLGTRLVATYEDYWTRKYIAITIRVIPCQINAKILVTLLDFHEI